MGGETTGRGAEPRDGDPADDVGVQCEVLEGGVVGEEGGGAVGVGERRGQGGHHLLQDGCRMLR
jgi:hypothetical protein